MVSLKIADFGMARDVGDDTYYKVTGGKIPVKWTAPEVSSLLFWLRVPKCIIYVYVQKIVIVITIFCTWVAVELGINSYIYTMSVV